MEKTISHLNSKAWYRLIKVIYLAVILIALGISTTVIVEANSRRFDNKNSYITCNDGRKFYLKDTSVHLSGGYVPSYYESDVRHLCLTNSELGDKAKNKYPAQYSDLTNEEIGRRLRDNNALFIESVNVQTKNYNLTSIYKERNWLMTIGKAILAGAIILLAFEIFRRIFYYIILGRIFPIKKST